MLHRQVSGNNQSIIIIIGDWLQKLKKYIHRKLKMTDGVQLIISYIINWIKKKKKKSVGEMVH